MENIRRIALTIAMIFTISIVAAQEKIEIDSILISHPISGKIIYTVKKHTDMDKVLDSLSINQMSRKFNLYYYFKDGRVVRCRVIKKQIFNTTL